MSNGQHVPALEVDPSGAPEVHSPTTSIAPPYSDGLQVQDFRDAEGLQVQESTAPEAHKLASEARNSPPVYRTPVGYQNDGSMAPEAYNQPHGVVGGGGPDGETKLAAVAVAETEGTKPRPRKKLYWILLIAVLLVIVAVAGGVGGAMANKKTTSKSTAVASESDTGGNTTPTATSSSGSSTRTNTVSVATTTSTAAPMADSNFSVLSWNTTFWILYQDRSGNFRQLESNYTLESQNHMTHDWSRAVVLPISAKKGTPISAVTWASGSINSVRVYTFSSDNILQEWTWNTKGKKWAGGYLDGDTTVVSENSGVAAVYTGGESLETLRVFYQDTNNRLTGRVWKGGWSPAVKFTATDYSDWPLLNTAGSGLTATIYTPLSETLTNSAYYGVTVFYQDQSGKLNSWVGSGVDSPSEAWVKGTQQETVPDGAELSTTIVPSSQRELQLFYIDNGELVADSWNPSAVLLSSGVNKTSDAYLGSDGLAATGPGVVALTLGEIVLVICGTTGWPQVYQYTPGDNTWSTVTLPTKYFEGS